MKARMQQRRNLLKVNLKVIPIVAMLLVPLTGFSKVNHSLANDSVPSEEKRVELKLKQRHSGMVPNNNMYADGIKIHKDLSTLKNFQEQRIIEEGEIPSDDLYQGVWANTGVRTAYTTIEKAMPDSFRVDLSNFTMPTKGNELGYITSNFGPRKRRMHYGVDLKVLTGDTIYAAFDGKVRVKQYEKRGYGYYLVVRHANGLETVYGHLSKFLVSEEQVVRSGEPIALGGNTGRSSGAHLHFEFRFFGKAIDPTLIVDVKNEVCHRDDFLVTTKVLSSPKQVYVAGKGGVKYHRVRSGDTLSAIARKYRTTVVNLRKMNGMSAKTVLQAGKSLKVPA